MLVEEMLQFNDFIDKILNCLNRFCELIFVGVNEGIGILIGVGSLQNFVYLFLKLIVSLILFDFSIFLLDCMVVFIFENVCFIFDF